MPSVYTRYTDYADGIWPDMPGDLIPEGGVLSAINMLFDKPGKARKRGGTYGTSGSVKGARWLASISPTTGDPTVMAASIYVDGSSHVQAKIGRPDLTHVAISANDNETYMNFMVSSADSGNEVGGATGGGGATWTHVVGSASRSRVRVDSGESAHHATDLPVSFYHYQFFTPWPTDQYGITFAMGDTGSVGVNTTTDHLPWPDASGTSGTASNAGYVGPVTPVAGDLVLCFIMVRGNKTAAAPTDTSGNPYTLVYSGTAPGGVNTYLYKRVATGTEVPLVQTSVLSASADWSIMGVVFSTPSSSTIYVMDERLYTQTHPSDYEAIHTALAHGSSGTGFWDGVITNYPADVLEASLTVSGRPFEFMGFLFWPLQSLRREANWMVVYGGVVLDSNTFAAYHSTGDISLAFTAGSQLVTASGTSFLTKLQVGQVVTIRDSLTAPTFAFVSRVTKVVDNTHFYVESKLPKTLTLHNADALWADPLIILPDHYGLGNLSSTIACAWQYRIVMGAPSTWTAASAAQGPTDYSRTIIWTTLPQAFDLGVSSNAGLYIGGLTAALRESVMPNNFLTIPEAQPLVALAPLFSDQLVYFGKSEMWAINGDFVTQDEDTIATDSLSVKNISRVIGCLSQNSVQQCSRGIAFCSSDGMYIYNGALIKPMMTQRVANTFRNLIQAGATIRGSGIIRTNHYAVSLSNDQTYMCNLDNGAWTVLTNVNLFDALAADPNDPSKTWGALYGNIAGDPSTWGVFTGGQIVRLDTMFVPGPTYKYDANGVAVTSSLTTRSYVEGDPEMRKIYQTLMYEYYLKGAASTVTVSADTSLEPLRATFAAIGALPQNAEVAITGATNASPIVVTAAGHGYATGDHVDIRSVGGNAAANGRWIIDVISSSTFSLRTSTGDGSYTSGGTVRQSDARSFHVSPKLKSGFGITHTFTQTGATDEFEVLGTKHGFRAMRQGRDS